MAYIMKKDIHSYIQQLILRNLERNECLPRYQRYSQQLLSQCFHSRECEREPSDHYISDSKRTIAEYITLSGKKIKGEVCGWAHYENGIAWDDLANKRIFKPIGQIETYLT